MSAFWPGPLTLILHRREGVAAPAAGGQNTIGLRCPSHPVAQSLLSALRKPPAGQREVWGVAAPSANQFGRVSPTTASHVQSEFGEALLILDGGPCDVGIESTIIDCTRGGPVMLRPGGITSEQIEAACGRRLMTPEEMETAEAAPRASGTLESHYAPNAKVRLMDARALQKALDMLGSDVDRSENGRGSIAVYSRAVVKSASRQIVMRRMPTDAAVAAHELFSVLRELDDQKVKLIWVETPPSTPEWEGVRDRLQRASA
jgi:L-threonylcarbamoyladenylate synthase